MYKSKIIVPDSVRFCFRSSANSEAIQLVLYKKEPPQDSTWSELSEFYTAQLAAYKTQYDFWCFLMELNEAIWDEKVDRLNDCEEIPMVDYEGENRSSFVWDHDSFYKGYYIKNYHLFLYTNFDSDGPRLSFYIYNENDENFLSDEWGLSEKWETIPSDNTRYTKKKLIPFEDNSSFDLFPLHEAADEIITLIEEWTSRPNEKI